MALTTDFAGIDPGSRTAGSKDYSRYRIVPARHPGRLAGTIFAAVVIIAVLYSIFTNPRWGWGVFAEWFFAEPVLVGLGRTLLLTVLAAISGSILGTALALARVSKSPLLSGLSWGYIWLLRSIPVIVLLLILNNLGYLYETIKIGIPFTDTVFLDYPTVQLLTPFAAAFLGLTLNQSAFFAEIVRGGILSVDHGQLEAAAALGLPRRRQAFRIVLPQAMRSILPTGFNELIGLAKSTSMVYVLALPELFYTVQVIYRRNLEVIPLPVLETATDTVRKIGFRDAATLRAAGGAVRIHGISKSFGSLKVLDDVELSLPAGSVTAILGPSGSGKSTLLRAINHLERVDEGFISVDGDFVGYSRKGDTLYELKEKDILKRRADIGMVFQSFNLFPHLTVLENLIEAPIQVRGVGREDAVQLAQELLARIGLSDKINAYPRQLSGGQQQRVAIARALALRPKVLLFDEPTSALDPELVGEVLDVIKELARTGTTLVIVTHEVGFAREVADTVVFMDGGRILEAGPPARIFAQAEHPRTREFLAKVL
ncbi:amino acid ABC transporter permease/ATP-binding protein (plasmid) [Rhizobium ruizarguesonis]|uniref:amino acid ABC transporter permease/ATP-binding protein n=1 Tax=Rhizobium ruizarguesonis TaxID=2081791 RepID=UPI0010318F12|nr:amino acid ABC transporter permease/ATP-binding protein [Rhizobium ruizarguesonis]TAY09251.1 amino acid ABC transporter permease/ATP-binding protein [Rhizobium ruizarguesonis]